MKGQLPNRAQWNLDGNVHTTYDDNSANLLTTLTDDVSQNFIYSYDLTNKLTSRTAPNGITSTFDYDGVSLLAILVFNTESVTESVRVP